MTTLTVPGVSSATTVLPVSLEDMTSRALLIFHGKAVSEESRRDEHGLIATYTTFDVIEVIKGTAGYAYTIKQIGGQASENGLKLRFFGLPGFEIGKEYIVFLPAKSTLGFQSPLGLTQGSFAISSLDDDQLVSNGRSIGSLLSRRYDNETLSAAGLRAMVPSITAPGHAHIDPVHGKPRHARKQDFLDAVKQMAGER